MLPYIGPNSLAVCRGCFAIVCRRREKGGGGRHLFMSTIAPSFSLSKYPQGAHAPIDMDNLSGNPAAAIGKQIRGQLSNILR